MYFIKNGVKHNVYEAVDTLKDEYVYIIECDECGETYVVPEYAFIELVETGEIDIICDECDECDDCVECSERDEEFDIDEEIVNDVKDSLLDIKSAMNQLMEDGCYDEYAKLADVYVKLYNLIY